MQPYKAFLVPETLKPVRDLSAALPTGQDAGARVYPPGRVGTRQKRQRAPQVSVNAAAAAEPGGLPIKCCSPSATPCALPVPCLPPLSRTGSTSRRTRPCQQTMPMEPRGGKRHCGQHHPTRAAMPEVMDPGAPRRLGLVNWVVNTVDVDRRPHPFDGGPPHPLVKPVVTDRTARPVYEEPAAGVVELVQDGLGHVGLCVSTSWSWVVRVRSRPGRTSASRPA